MKIFRTLALAAFAAAMLLSCSPRTTVVFNVKGGAGENFVVKQLNVSSMDVLDTLKADAAGSFKYKPEILEGQPEFLYFYHNDRQIASLLLLGGENVKVEADTLGRYTVEGSDESVKLQRAETAFRDFSARINKMALQGNPDTREMSKIYVDYYRTAVKFVVENKGSMVAIPVLYQKFNGYSPIFSQATDAMFFRSTCDTLTALYPKSAYVKALQTETERRENILNFQAKLSNTETLGFPPLELPDINSRPVTLAESLSKVTLLHFWDPTDAAQKMLTMDVLKPLYEQYHDRGLNIYSVALCRDKVLWASVVKAQKLEWVNVCDGLGAASPCMLAYNIDVDKMPVTFLLANDGIVSGNVSNKVQLSGEIAKLLK